MLIVGRAVSGTGGAGLVNGALTILSTCVALEKRARKLRSFAEIFEHCADIRVVVIGIMSE